MLLCKMLQLSGTCGRPTKAAALLLVCAVLAVLCSSAPAAASEVPNYEPEKWNKAYVFYYGNIKGDQQSKLIPSYCDEQGDMKPSAAEIDSCYWQKEKNGTYSYWEKVEGSIHENTNCYCYALNAFKDGFCIPSKVLDTDEATCDVIRASIVADGGKVVSREEALGGQPSTGHYIAMLSRNDGCIPDYCWEYDFHAVRKDSNGLWSWKEPTGSVNNKDVFGKLIQDPENQKIPGEYETFCGFYQVWPEKMTIRGYFGEDTIEEVLSYRKRRTEGMYPNVAVWLEPSEPYNASVDGVLNQASRFEAEKEWESQRGSQAWRNYYAENPNYRFTQGDDPSITSSNAVKSDTASGNEQQASGASGAAGRKMLKVKPLISEAGGDAAVKPAASAGSTSQPKLLSSIKRNK